MVYKFFYQILIFLIMYNYYNCTECESGSYKKEDDGDNCYNETPEGYYFYSDGNIYKKCFSSCKKCNQGKTETKHNCEECIEGKSFITDEGYETNCYSICKGKENRYYFDNYNTYQCYNFITLIINSEAGEIPIYNRDSELKRKISEIRLNDVSLEENNYIINISEKGENKVELFFSSRSAEMMGGFMGIGSIISADLSALTNEVGCFDYMFHSCTNLKTVNMKDLTDYGILSIKSLFEDWFNLEYASFW